MVEDDNDGEDNYYAGRTVFVYTSESTATERRKMDPNRRQVRLNLSNRKWVVPKYPVGLEGPGGFS